MIDRLEGQQAGVVCLHCGKQIPLPISFSMNQGPMTESVPVLSRRMSIVRCRLCGKEAPYLARHIITVSSVPDAARAAA